MLQVLPGSYSKLYPNLAKLGEICQLFPASTAGVYLVLSVENVTWPLLNFFSKVVFTVIVHV